MAESAVSAVVGSIGNAAVQETSLLCGVLNEVEFLKEELTSLQCFLKDADAKWRMGSASVANWVHRISDVAYQAENIIEAAEYMAKRNRLKRGFMGAVSRYARIPTDLITLHNIGVEIRRIRRKIIEIAASRATLNISDLGGGAVDEADPLHVERLISPNPDEDVVVGLEDDYKQIVQELVNGENDQLSVVAIVGMGGVGKSTFARKVYTSSTIKQHFSAFAFVSISERFEVLRVLKDVTKQVMGIKDENRGLGKMGGPDEMAELLDKMGEEEIRKKLQGFLKERRYLIMLDDVWTMNAWNLINTETQVFPDTNNGSKVLLTTRNLNVAKQANKRTYVHELRNLNDGESWNLFRSKDFPSYENISMDTIVELESVGRRLAEKCHGLPLALVVLGGHLSKNIDLKTWSEMDQCLDWETMRNGENMQYLIARSYNDISNHYLKSCFLYISSFPEDCVIPSFHLANLWIAEGFVPHRSNHTLEDTARDYMEELAQRNMVQVFKRSKAHGWIEGIKIHDILREWCIQEARKDGFLNWCRNREDFDVLSSGAMTTYRVAFRNFFDDEISQSRPNLRTLIGFDLPPTSNCMLRFLRVLYLQDSNLEFLSKEISRLIHLRYLGLIDCKNVVLPSSIGRLLNLQTIDLRGTEIPSIPNSLWDIPALRHVYLADVEKWMHSRIGEQKELQTLAIWQKEFSEVRDYIWRRIIKSLVQMTQLTILQFIQCNVPEKILTSFSHHHYLLELYLAKVVAIYKLPDCQFFPPNLRVLHLGIDCVLREDPMTILGKLPYLVVLGFGVAEYEGQSMCCSRVGFPRLQKLRLVWAPVEKLRFEVGSMPRLTKLTLDECRNMRRLPEGLLDLQSLKDLVLQEMEELPKECYEELEKKGCKVMIQQLLYLAAESVCCLLFNLLCLHYAKVYSILFEIIQCMYFSFFLPKLYGP